MPNVNLIAARREEKKRLERITRELFFGLAASITVLVLLLLYLGAARFKLDADLADAQEKKQKLQPILDQITQIEKETADLKPKVDTLETAKRVTLHWRALFTVISESTPDSVWINQIRSDGGDTGTITLMGITDTQTHVGDMIKLLQQHPIFEPQVDLTFVSGPGKTKTDKTGGFQPVNFQLVTHLRPPPAPPAPAAAAGATQAAAVTNRQGDSHGATA